MPGYAYQRTRFPIGVPAEPESWAGDAVDLVAGPA
jgi:hypothetical protein